MQYVRYRWWWVGLILGLSSGSGCSPGATTIQAPSPEPRNEEYVIGAEDVLEIAVWQNQDLSRTVTVRPDGKISLPLVHDIQAAGLTPDELKQALTRSLRPYMDAPNVTVIVQQINSWRIFVQGEVRTPGVYPIKSRTTLSQAIALAGGFTEFARKGKIKILRRKNGRTETISVNYNRIVSDPRSELDIYLKPGDTVIVP